MSSIVKREWDFGDGHRSSLQSPLHVYKSPGIYDVSLTVTFGNGDVRTVTKRQYIRVYSVSDSIIIDGSPDKRRSIVYGTDKTFGTGWTLFTGEDWIRPETTEAITDINIDGKFIQIVFDRVGRAFVMSDRTSETFKDKVGYKEILEDGTTSDTRYDGTPIQCHMITPEYVGESSSYRLTHEQSFFELTPYNKLTDVIPGTSVQTQLIHDGNIVYEQKIQNVSPKEEQLFSIKKRADRVQFGLKTSQSGIKIVNVETSLKVEDVARYSSGMDTADFGFQLFLSSSILWLCRYDYSLDRSSGENIDIEYEHVLGPDNINDSAMKLLAELTIPTANSTSVSLFCKNFDHEYNVLYEKDIEDYKFLVIDTTDEDNLVFQEDTILYDIRVMENTLTEMELYDDYVYDVVENSGVKFLPEA